MHLSSIRRREEIHATTILFAGGFECPGQHLLSSLLSLEALFAEKSSLASRVATSARQRRLFPCHVDRREGGWTSYQ